MGEIIISDSDIGKETITGYAKSIPYDFSFHDFGKVLFLIEDHRNKRFETSAQYIEFFEEEERKKQKLKTEQEQAHKRAELKRLKDEEKKHEDKLKRLQQIAEAKQKRKYNDEESSILSQSNDRLERKHFPKDILDERSKIKEIVRSRRINNLVHFTRTDNLNSILKYGLVPVKSQRNNYIPSLHNDDRRMDGHDDCTSCSIEFPNYKLFYRFRNKFPECKWVIIQLNIDVLFSESNISYFCRTNAASQKILNDDFKSLYTAKSLEQMYEEYIFDDGRVALRERLKIAENLTTDPQAEILISDTINRNYIDNIFFESKNDIDWYISRYGEEWLSRYNFQVKPFFFDHRTDYKFW